MRSALSFRCSQQDKWGCHDSWKTREKQADENEQVMPSSHFMLRGLLLLANHLLISSSASVCEFQLQKEKSQLLINYRASDSETSLLTNCCKSIQKKICEVEVCKLEKKIAFCKTFWIEFVCSLKCCQGGRKSRFFST